MAERNASTVMKAHPVLLLVTNNFFIKLNMSEPICCPLKSLSTPKRPILTAG